MTVNQKQKGKRGELEAVAFLKDHGYEARRGQQYGGGGDTPDVLHTIPGVHLEVKRRERFRIYDSMEQAQSDAQDGEMPAVMYRANRKPWLIVMDAEDWLKLIDKALGNEVVDSTDWGETYR